VGRPVLWHIELSHYNEKVRWALDHKRVAHARRAPLPGLHGLPALLLTGQRRLPILELEGRAIAGSATIIAALEEHRPEPPLFPEDPADRERALTLADFFDEHVAPAIRAHGFHHTSRHPEMIVAGVMPRAEGLQAAALRAFYTAAVPYIHADYKTTPDAGPIRAGMDRLEREIGPSGYLVGDRFSVADLTAAALFTPLLAPPQRPYLPRALPPEVLALREELTARPGGRWVFEMYARHR
jgi:glutathione S-transferase